MKKRAPYLKKYLTIILIILIILFLYTLIPKGRIIQGQTYSIPESSIEFLQDLTYTKNNQTIYNHEIFNKTYEIIDQAQEFIILDMFLFGTTSKPHYKNLTQELTTHLINKKTNNPEIIIYFITDNFNIINKPQNKQFFTQLKQNNITTISTPIPKNPLTKIITPYLKKDKKRLNHRKILIADNNNQTITLITSANPHDESSANSNTGIIIKQQIHNDIFKYEKQDAQITDEKLEQLLKQNQQTNQPNKSSIQEKTIQVQYLADGGAIKSIKQQIDQTTKGDSIKIATFYISDKQTTKKLIKASKREVDIKIILDTNENFFGKKRYGIPNKPVANTLTKKGNNIKIKWYESQGEQFHTKIAIIKTKQNTTITLGSSNLADNQILFYNLQSDIKLTASNKANITTEINNYFNKIWNNQNITYSAPYEKYKSNSLYKKLKYEYEQFIRMFQ